MKYPYILLLIILLQACASSFVITPRQNQILTSLTETDAEDIAKRIFINTENQSGLFMTSHSRYVSVPKLLSIEDGIITFVDYEEHLSVV